MVRILFILIFVSSISFSQTSMNMNLLGTYNYPNTEGSDIWGWTDNTGNEYALVTLQNGFSVVDVTNPSTPNEKFFISDLTSTWRDVKTWGNYAYVTTEADAGLLIVDLSDMSGNTYWRLTQFTNPNNGSSITFTAAHNIYIDENGVAYIFGASSNVGTNPADGAIFLDVNANPINPHYLGNWNENYIHDGMVRGDTMWAGCIYAGELFAVDVSNKSNPVTLGSYPTPNNFTHNIWVSDDGNFVFTTDETSNAYLAAYDVSDLNNIQEVDRIQSNPGSGSIPHNTHVDGNFLITSYYRDGTTVHDITYPNNMVQVAYYDSYSGSGNGFDGCWGTYPFLPSGNIISSDINSGPNGGGRLLVYQRDFQQASFIQGNVTDGNTGLSISSATVQIVNSSYNTSTNLFGNYDLASLEDGNVQVQFSAPGYIPVILNVNLISGNIITLNAVLFSGSGVLGCTDPLANNYDPSANVDDGSCCYGDLITIDITTDNYPTETSWQLINQSGVVVASINSGDLTQANSSYSWSICPSSTDCYDFIIYDTYGDGICCSYGNGSYSVSYNGNVVASGGSFGTSETNSSIGSCIVPIVGCMNPSASNYDPLANTSTSFGGIFDPNGGSGAYFNGNRHLLVDANVPAKIVSADVYSNSSSNTITFELRDNTSSVIDDTTLTLVQGQQRINLNFDIPVGNNYELGISSSNTSPGLYRSNDAAFVNYPYDIGGLISITESSASVADQYYYYFYNIEVEAMCVGLTTPILGCTDPTACNYDPSANTDDGSCLTDYGCTDPTAFNYDPTATCDDGSCIAIVYGCTDPLAINYFPGANLDNGSCCYVFGCTEISCT